MLLGNKIKLKPTEEQEQQFFQFAGTARFAYNFALGLREHIYETEKRNISIKEIKQTLASLKHNDEEYLWLNDIPEAVTKEAIKDVDEAYKRFFKKIARKPKFKKRSQCACSFYQRTDRLHSIDETHIKITGIKTPVKTSKHKKIENPQNPRVIYDGKYWYLTYANEKEEQITELTDKVIGVDLGVKEFAITSENIVYHNINKTRKIKVLEKRKRRLQRIVSKKRENNKEGKKYKKTLNIIKEEKKIRLIDRKISNIRKTYVHTISKDLVKAKPKKIVIEDLKVSNMMKNRHLAKAIQSQCFNKFRTFLEYKCKLYGIELVVADTFYPSSKLCSCCGNKKIDLKLKDRVYVCSKCGLKIDRDLNASINLSKYKVG